MMGEHSPVDALIPSMIADWVISEPMDLAQFSESSAAATPVAGLELLQWETDDHILEQCTAAKERAMALIRDSDAGILWHSDYGVDWIRNHAKLSPDAYIQMALQLAWFMSRGTATATYETASTRLFLQGRTETIRTLSRESAEFVKSMIDPTSSVAERHSRLVAATVTHNKSTRDAAMGKGIDRHLLGLRVQMREGESSPFLDDELFGLSQEWNLSTSGLSAGDRFLGTGFGAPFHDGYGINYLTGAHVLKFGIESKHSSSLTSTHAFKRYILDSLAEMKALCLAVATEQEQETKSKM